MRKRKKKNEFNKGQENFVMFILFVVFILLGCSYFLFKSELPTNTIFGEEVIFLLFISECLIPIVQNGTIEIL